MSGALTVLDRSAGVLATDEQLDLLRHTVARDCNPAEFDLFVGVCRRLDLDPFAKQIAAVKRWDKKTGREAVTFAVTIDGMRTVAERSRKYRGQTPAQWTADGKTWVDVWAEDRPPLAARVGVYREDFEEPAVAVALYADYVQTSKKGEPFGWWAKSHGAHMIAKCAEALALRKAFPMVLGGVYTTEELGQDATARIDFGDDTAPEAEIESIEETPTPKRPPEWVSKSQAAFRKLAAQFDDPKAWAVALNVALKRYKMRQVETGADADHWVRSTLPELGAEAARLVYAGAKKGLNNA